MTYDFKVNDVTPGQDGGKRLSIIRRGAFGEVAEATHVEFKTAELGVVEGHVVLHDFLNDEVRDFLQGALNAAWDMGLRPTPKLSEAEDDDRYAMILRELRAFNAMVELLTIARRPVTA